MSYNGQILHVKHFCVTLSGPITFEAIRPPWRPILKMGILGQIGNKSQKAYDKVHQLWRNNLKKLIGLWEIDKTLWNGGRSITQDLVDWLASKFRQMGTF